MKVFITGASGHIGTRVVPELIQAGHSVIGLVRSNEGKAKLQQMGAETRQGSIDDTGLLTNCAAEADGIIHLAFRHDLMQAGKMDEAAQVDAAAVTAMIEPLKGSNKSFVGVSGTLGLAFAGLDHTATEEDVVSGNARSETENMIIGSVNDGVRSSVVRLAPTVHGPNDHGFIASIIQMARDNGYAAYVGDGANRWPALHVNDAGTLFRRAVEAAPGGSRLHGVGESGITFKAIAETIGEQLELPVKSISTDEAAGYFTFLSNFVVLDNPASNDITRSLLDWQPTQPGLIKDMVEGDYFR